MRSLVGLSALLLFPAVLLADLGLAVAGGWWRPAPLAWVAMGIAGFALLSLIVTPLHRWIGRSAAGIWIACVATLISLTLSEIALRSWMPRADYHRRLARTTYRLDPSPWAMPGVSQPAEMVINPDGLRGHDLPETRHDYRIVCVGGGTTECLYLDDSETWPALLSQGLREELQEPVSVDSAGHSGYASREHAKFIERSNLLTQIDCLVVMVGPDDVLQRLVGTIPVRPRVTQTRLFSLLADAMGRQSEPGLFADFHGVGLVQARQKLYERQRHFDVDQALAEFESQIRRIIRVAQQRKVRLVFVAAPVLWDDVLDERAQKVLRYARILDKPNPDDWVQPRRCRELADLFNERLFVACREAECEVVDLTFLSALDLLFHDDIHFNEAGCRELARPLVEYFVRSGLRRE